MTATHSSPTPAAAGSPRKFLAIALLACVALAVFVSPFASSSPDGLEAVAEKQGFIERAESATPLWQHSPVPDYAVPGVKHEGIATAAAGLLGTLLTFGVVYGATRLFAKTPRT